MLGCIALMAANSARAHQDPPGCLGNISSSGINVVGPTGVKKAHVGEVARIQVLNFGVPSVGCSASAVLGRVLPGAGSPLVFCTNASFTGGTAANPFNPPLGDVINCPGPDPRCSTNSVASGFYVYTILAGDVTGEVTNAQTCPFPFNNPGNPHRVVYFFVTGTGVDHASPAGELTFSACNNDVLDILTPRIQCTKNCTNGVGQNGAITFGGSVMNTGDATLFNVSVSNSVNGGLTLVTNIASLAPGQSVGFNGSYVPNNPCVPTTDTILVRGTDELGLTVTSSCTATCSNVITPCIRVTKNCDTVLLGQANTVSGVVSNCGNITITNITVNDSLYGVVGSIASLAPGASQAYSRAVTNTSCGDFPNTATATGTTICGQPVQHQANAVCTVICPPRICVVKDVACFLGTNSSDCPPSRPYEPLEAGENCGPFGQTATGVRGDSQYPAFCYRITVRNCGTITLTNVSVVDNEYGDLTTNFTCLADRTLTPGESCTFTFKAEVGQNLTNTVEAAGYSVATGQRTNAFDDAVVHVIPARITCVKQFSVDGGPWVSDYEFTDQDVHTVVWRVVLNNTGSANLLNVHVSDVSSNLGCSFATVVPLIPAGGSVTLGLCTNSSFVCTNSQDFVNAVRVVSNQYSSTNAAECICAYDIEGVRISVRSECEARIRCTQPNACRVTGGGRQEAPEHTCPDDVRYVTHGGQVGAPVGERTCAIDTNLPNYFLGNPCIHGRWTHVRHTQGGLRGNFHARFFDTLDCACLDTNVGPGGVYGPGTTTGGVCGDRNIGPLPRPAPANKIVFTGVGDWADPNGRRDSRATLFRVDIEDRGEPGNSHAQDANGKPGRVPDRYRIRIWVLTQSELNQLNGAGPDRYLLNFRNAISACNGINVRDGVNIANSCGPQGVSVFGQRAPDIDDGGELDHGNHQIHPTIKDCDPYNPTGPGLANP